MLDEFRIYLELGFRHIADLAGYDHILFVTALAIPFGIRDWRRLAILVTAFTVGHSITLALATLRLVSVSSQLVETLIPATILVTALVVFVERGQRKILVNYAKRQVGKKVYGGQSSHLPLKLNMAGVIPPIFASSIILFPATLAGWFGSGENMAWLRNIGATLHPGQPIYVLLYAGAIVFFCFFYTALVFNPKETAENLKKGGAFVPGIRPGDQTARYIERIITRLTLAGAIYITVVCLLPEFLIVKWNVPFYFGGTSLLIIVVVTMDFMAQVQAYMMSHQYESLLKKANFKGGAFPTR
jgi:preprotein translocase subunit SecY